MGYVFFGFFTILIFLVFFIYEINRNFEIKN